MFEDEDWRNVVELPHYMVSNYGRVVHVDRPTQPRAITINDKGFPVVTLYGGDSKTRYLRQINKLVAAAFLPQPIFDNETQVWHIDGNLQNCHVSNLKWETRPRVLEWNEMHRSLKPAYKTPRVRNNRTGRVYANAFECAMAEGRLESDIVWRVERQARNTEDDAARYRYLWSEKEL